MHAQSASTMDMCFSHPCCLAMNWELLVQPNFDPFVDADYTFVGPAAHQETVQGPELRAHVPFVLAFDSGAEIVVAVDMPGFGLTHGRVRTN